MRTMPGNDRRNAGRKSPGVEAGGGVAPGPEPHEPTLDPEPPLPDEILWVAPPEVVAAALSAPIEAPVPNGPWDALTTSTAPAFPGTPV